MKLVPSPIRERFPRKHHSHFEPLNLQRRERGAGAGRRSQSRARSRHGLHERERGAECVPAGARRELLEEGVSLRLISQYLGHASLDVTVIHTHLTATSEGRARAALDRLMK